MFNFKKKTLTPLIAASIAKIDAALKTEGSLARAEKLLDAKDEKEKSIQEALNTADRPTLWGAFAAFAGLAAPMLLSGLVAWPVSLGIAAVLYLGGIGTMMKTMSNKIATRVTGSTLGNKIDTEVMNLVEAAPQEVLKSPRVLKALKDSFNPPAARDGKAYQELAASVAPKPSARAGSRMEPVQQPLPKPKGE